MLQQSPARPAQHARPGSLIRRLAIAYAAIGLGAVVAGAYLLHNTLLEVVWTEHQRGILAAGSEVIDRLEAEGLKGLDRPFSREEARRFDTATGSMLYVVLDETGHQLRASPGASGLLPRFGERGLPAERFQTGRRGARIWGITRWIDTPDGRVAVQIAQDMDRAYIVLDDVPEAAFGPVVWVLGLGVLLLFLINLGLVLLLLRPLRRAVREAEQIGHGSPGRLDRGGMPREVTPLIDAVNGALDRLDEALAWQRGFSAEVAHELRTPLALLHAELELLDSGEVTSRLRRDVEQLAELITDLLEAAAAAQEQPLRDGTFDLTLLAAETARRFSAVAEREGHMVRLELPEEPIPLRGEGESIGRALRNLLENAVSHSPAGAPVTLRVAREGAQALVEIADQGKGIAEADLPNLFRRHWRAGDSRRRGLGLGLSIVARIVTAHGGTVTAYNAESGGGVFRIMLPAAEPAAH
ncbi:HAMP domain-containing histidine kinase [Acetobacteraceae bacterium H6797]|nr:HAMP domain-containing histidine kinase [Acetobacteraceae bacterium H6797]